MRWPVRTKCIPCVTCETHVVSGSPAGSPTPSRAPTTIPSSARIRDHGARGTRPDHPRRCDHGFVLGSRRQPVYRLRIAFTRVAGREFLLILRPFAAAPFQKGVGLGRELLLRHLRGEQINWKALLAKYCEERPCSTCGERRQSCAFTAGQWKRDDKDRVCRECTQH